MKLGVRFRLRAFPPSVLAPRLPRLALCPGFFSVPLCLCGGSRFGRAVVWGQFTAVACHVAFVLGQRGGEDMAAVVVAHKVERVARGGVERGADRGLARRADGP